MRLAAIRNNGERWVGVVEDDVVVPLEGIQTLSAQTIPRLLGARRLTRSAVRWDELEPQLPVEHPEKVVCIGLNYQTHVEETQREVSAYPVLFAKFGSSLIGPFDPIMAPPESSAVDYEAELAIVIGRPIRRATRAEAADSILGYTIANDVTMRDYQYKTHQWLQGKAWDRSTPVGPMIVTPDEWEIGSNNIRLTVNGTELQQSPLSAMMLDPIDLLRTISEFTTLSPGDLVLTGTPAGIGYRREPQVLLRDGDVVRVEIDGIGFIENTVRSEGKCDANNVD